MTGSVAMGFDVFSASLASSLEGEKIGSQERLELQSRLIAQLKALDEPKKLAIARIVGMTGSVAMGSDVFSASLGPSLEGVQNWISGTV